MVVDGYHSGVDVVEVGWGEQAIAKALLYAVVTTTFVRDFSFDSQLFVGIRVGTDFGDSRTVFGASGEH